MRKYLHLFMKMNSRSPVVTTCCFIMLFMMAFITDSTVGTMAGNYYQYDLVKNCKDMFQYTIFSDKDVYTDDIESTDIENNRQRTLNKIRKIDGVSNVYTIQTATYSDSKRYSQIDIIRYSEKLFDYLKYKCMTGRMPLRENEIVLNASARKRYKLNDEYDIQDGEETKRVKVVGFLENDLIFYPDFSADKDNEKGANTALGVADRREQAISGEFTAISWYNDEWSGLQTFDTVIIDCSLKDKSKLMNSIDKKYGYTYDMNDTLKYYYKNSCNIFKQESFYLLIAFAVLFVIGFCIHGVLYLYNQKKEFAIYYLCGCTWKKSLYLSVSRIFLLFVTAIPLGFITLRLLRKFDTSLIGYVLKVQNEILIFICMICLYLICCIPVFLIFGRVDTYDLFRREEGI